MRKLEFIRCLPESEHHRCRSLVVNNQVSFEDLVSKFQAQHQHLMPSFQAEAIWKKCAPASRKWSDIDHWFSEWLQLASECKNLSEEMMKEQFKRMIIALHPKLVQSIHQLEISGSTFTLVELWNIVANKLQATQLCSQLKSSYEEFSSRKSSVNSMHRSPSGGKSTPPRNKSPQKGCFICGSNQHFQKDCPKNRGRSPSRNSAHGSDRSRGSRSLSGRSNSSQGSRFSRGSGRKKFFSKSRHDRRGSSPSRRFSGSGKPGSASPRRFSRGSDRPRPGSRSPVRSAQSSPRTPTGSKSFSKPSRSPSRDKIMSRQRSGQCLTCGSSSHHTSSCPSGKNHGRGRSPTSRRSPNPRRSPNFRRSPHRGKGHPRQKVNLKVSSVEDPLASGREGDVTDSDEEAVNAYLAARSIAAYASASDRE